MVVQNKGLQPNQNAVRFLSTGIYACRHDYSTHPSLLLRITKGLQQQLQMKRTTNHQIQNRKRERDERRSLVEHAIDANRLVTRQKIVVKIQCLTPMMPTRTASTILPTWYNFLPYQQAFHLHPHILMGITTPAIQHPIPHPGYQSQLTRGRIVRYDE